MLLLSAAGVRKGVGTSTGMSSLLEHKEMFRLKKLAELNRGYCRSNGTALRSRYFWFTGGLRIVHSAQLLIRLDAV
jgi:hypothetical protein